MRKKKNCLQLRGGTVVPRETVRQAVALVRQMVETKTVDLRDVVKFCRRPDRLPERHVSRELLSLGILDHNANLDEGFRTTLLACVSPHAPPGRLEIDLPVFDEQGGDAFICNLGHTLLRPSADVILEQPSDRLFQPEADEPPDIAEADCLGVADNLADSVVAALGRMELESVQEAPPANCSPQSTVDYLALIEEAVYQPNLVPGLSKVCVLPPTGQGPRCQRFDIDDEQAVLWLAEHELISQGVIDVEFVKVFRAAVREDESGSIEVGSLDPKDYPA